MERETHFTDQRLYYTAHTSEHGTRVRRRRSKHALDSQRETSYRQGLAYLNNFCRSSLMSSLATYHQNISQRSSAFVPPNLPVQIKHPNTTLAAKTAPKSPNARKPDHSPAAPRTHRTSPPASAARLAAPPSTALSPAASDDASGARRYGGSGSP